MTKFVLVNIGDLALMYHSCHFLEEPVHYPLRQVADQGYYNTIVGGA